MKKILVSLVFCFVALASEAANFTVNGIYYYTIDKERVGVSVDYDMDPTTYEITYHYYTGSLTIPSS